MFGECTLSGRNSHRTATKEVGDLIRSGFPCRCGYILSCVRVSPPDQRADRSKGILIIPRSRPRLNLGSVWMTWCSYIRSPNRSLSTYRVKVNSFLIISETSPLHNERILRFKKCPRVLLSSTVVACSLICKTSDVTINDLLPE